MGLGRLGDGAGRTGVAFGRITGCGLCRCGAGRLGVGLGRGAGTGCCRGGGSGVGRGGGCGAATTATFKQANAAKLKIDFDIISSFL